MMNYSISRQIASELSSKQLSLQNIRSISMRCQKCKEITFSPIICDTCNANICQKCRRSYKKGKICPLCLKLISSPIIFENSLFSKKIQSKNCKYFKTGCKFSCFKGNFDDHEKICGFQPSSCKNLRCNQSNILKKDQYKHDLECKFSNFKCEFCGLEISNELKIDHYKVCVSAQVSPKYNRVMFKRTITLLSLKVVCSRCKQNVDTNDSKMCLNCKEINCMNCTKACLFCKAYYCHKCSKKCPHSLDTTEIRKVKKIDLSKFVNNILSIKKTRFRKDEFLWKIGLLFRYLKNKNQLKISIDNPEFEKVDESSMIKIYKILKLDFSIYNIEFCKHY